MFHSTTVQQRRMPGQLLHTTWCVHSVRQDGIHTSTSSQLRAHPSRCHIQMTGAARGPRRFGVLSLVQPPQVPSPPRVEKAIIESRLAEGEQVRANGQLPIPRDADILSSSSWRLDAAEQTCRRLRGPPRPLLLPLQTVVHHRQYPYSRPSSSMSCPDSPCVRC